MKLFLAIAIIGYCEALRCFDGTVKGLASKDKTAEKDCGGISNYCIQRIDRKNNVIKRECSSFTDEHNMEEKCPMSGCHWQSKDETFCCCQFDSCNEWKGDGTEFRAGETKLPSSTKQPATAPPLTTSRPIIKTPTTNSPFMKNPLTTRPSFRRSDSEIVVPEQ